MSNITTRVTAASTGATAKGSQLTVSEMDANLNNLNADKLESNTAGSVDGEIALFSGTSGKQLKRNSSTGLLKSTSGVLATATAADIVATLSTTNVNKAAVADLASAVADNAISTNKVANNAISYAKMQQMNTLRLLGRSTAGVGNVEELHCSQLIDDWVLAASGAAAATGDILYRGGSAWTKLPPGTAGQVLKTNGPGAAPTWGDGSKYMNTGSVSMSGSSMLVTGIPANQKRITVTTFGAKATSSPAVYFRVGSSAGVMTTNSYSYAYAQTTYSSDGITTTQSVTPVQPARDTNSIMFGSLYLYSAYEYSGAIIKIILERVGTSNNWIITTLATTLGGGSYLSMATGVGTAILPGDLDRVQLYLGSYVFSSGIMSVSYEA